MRSKAVNVTEVKLPMVMPDGSRSSLHPFTWLLRFRWKESKRQLGIKVGVTAQAIYDLERKCEAHPRKYLLPAETARRLADAIGVNPGFLRPDLWPMKGAK